MPRLAAPGIPCVRFAPRPLTLREGDGRVCNPRLPVWAPFVLRTFPPRAGETDPHCRLVG